MELLWSAAHYRSADSGNQPALYDTESLTKTEKSHSLTGQAATYRMGANSTH